MIERHYQDPHEFILEDVEKYEQKFGDRVKALRNRTNDTLGYAFRDALQNFATIVAGGLEKTRALHALLAAKGIGVAIFASATNPGRPVILNLVDQTIEFTGQSTTAYVDVDTWLNAYYCAAIARDNAGIKTLCSVPESIHAKADLKPEPFDLAFVRAIKGLYDPEANIGQLLVDAMESFDPDKLSRDRRDYATRILYPQLPLFRCILSSNQTEFNEKLNQATLDHKAFWGKKATRLDKEGWIALHLIAACAVAFDNKAFVKTFETDYIPDWLARKEF